MRPCSNFWIEKAGTLPCVAPWTLDLRVCSVRSTNPSSWGAAFPTGRKWEAVVQAPVHPHYLICNADESEPGTFKDRILMEADPFAVIEAMTIAALATGCTQGLGKNPRRPMAHRRHCDTPHRTSRGPLPMHLRLAVRVE
jgi:hypothetical protein